MLSSVGEESFFVITLSYREKVQKCAPDPVGPESGWIFLAKKIDTLDHDLDATPMIGAIRSDTAAIASASVVHESGLHVNLSYLQR